jgi:hypothetical protein
MRVFFLFVCSFLGSFFFVYYAYIFLISISTHLSFPCFSVSDLLVKKSSYYFTKSNIDEIYHSIRYSINFRQPFLFILRIDII